MPAPEVSICSAALVLVGDSPIATLDGLEPRQVICSNLYEPTVKDLLGRYRWRFAARNIQLQRTDIVPMSEYDAAYLIPTVTNVVYSVKVRGEPIDFDRFEQHIYCNAGEEDEVVAEVQIVPSETYWPPYFRTLVQLQMAAVVAIPVTEDATKAAFYENKALKHFSLAKTLDAQNRTAKVIHRGGLRRYHGGRA